MEQNRSVKEISKASSLSCSTYGCGTGKKITGCRFSLYPMSDEFVPIILGALEKTDISAVWSESDALSTIYRGKREYVFDAVKAIFVNAWREDVHMTMEGNFSKGCPGDIAGESKLDFVGEAPNYLSGKDKNIQANCKYSLYPMGRGEYMEDIREVVEMANSRGLNPKSIHYATRINGEIGNMFAYLEDVCKHMEKVASHFIVHFTISVNSPTKEENI